MKAAPVTGIRQLQITLFPKQALAWRYLQDATTREVVYGGAAGGAKTFLGCVWQLHNRLRYPATRGLIGRARLKKLRATTLRTFWDVCTIVGLKPREDFNYHPAEGLITFRNGSEIMLRDLYAYPADPDFTALGSLELTDAFLDEVGELSLKAVQVLASRIRYKLDVVGKPPKLLMTCNPAKGWLYQNYYKPAMAGALPPDKVFIQSLLTDNLKADFATLYAEQLRGLDHDLQQRLLEGNWDYLDDAKALFNYQDLQASLRPAELPMDKEQNAPSLTVDVARFGQDLTTIGRWVGLHLAEVRVFEKQDTAATSTAIKELMQIHKISPGRVVIDADGIGGAVVDQVKGVRSFVALHKPLKMLGQMQQYEHFKAQCYYLLADYFKARKLSISPALSQQYINGKPITEALFEELLIIRYYRTNDEGKLGINRKTEQKAQLGRSPDLADMVMMRMMLELVQTVFKFA